MNHRINNYGMLSHLGAKGIGFDKFCLNIFKSIHMNLKHNSSGPRWMEPLLQGLAFWVGYRKQLYRHHELPEGSIVAEALALIHSNLNDPETVRCEYPYSGLCAVSDKSRADIVIFSGERPAYVIEVKRGHAAKAKKDLDILRLNALKSSDPSLRCFMLVVSQSHLPSQYVNMETGEALRGVFRLDEVKYKVLRVCKAASTFKNLGAANYVCLLEVLG
jgi:hypothetical protein